ncbi:MAG: signal recognition particle-docking protein FtsY [Candidatus Eisenbacteria bacterium]|uniref:Signal recognition particle receptor FtsY n=1 Tax=Eiseniibacteriota bacterium TaxID=2212470 RepID=A0A948RW62_UNCEI|nr:signal recognition particle-docking protein FtsY [Candidatus Eisenbacteria bacterium]MBU1949474.1 signal recognition particle-docking protein FtsY [Candidatus Eisenbacteria bacterium]MBU2692150.1 signal recognition particle-docking protein FtsY [Candidatus Eisenbacteria bacterium]
MKSLWKRMAGGMEKTRNRLANGIEDLIKRRPKLDDSFYEELEELLIVSDVGPQLSEELVQTVRERARQERVQDGEQLTALLGRVIIELLGGPSNGDSCIPKPNPESLHVISVIGVNGVGKTTTIGKLALRYQAEGHRPLIVASDTFRAAASEQLEVWGQRAGVEIVKSQSGADPGSVAFDGIQAARSRHATVVFVDTAGRLQTNANLMGELQKIHRVLDKAHPGAPHEVLLVLDAVVGQNGLSQAQSFRDAVGVTGLVLTKLDGSARGGSILPIRRKLGTPVQWIGIGEGINDLEPFEPEAFVEALLKPTGAAIP